MGFGFSFSRKKEIVALDIGSGAIKLVQLKKLAQGYQLQKFGVKALDPELIVDGTVMDSGQVVDVIKELLEEQSVQAKDVALSVSGHSVIVKKINVPMMTEEELEESIKWEAEQYIPFDINDVNIDFHILGESESEEAKDQMGVLLVAVKRERLTEYTTLVTETDLNPVIVDVDAFTLENMYGVNYDSREDEIVSLVNIGASVMNITILRGGTFAFTRDISIGGNRYSEAIQREFNVNYEQAERAKRGEAVDGVDPDALLNMINGLNEKISTEVMRSFEYYKTTSSSETIDRILVSGGSAKLPNLLAHLAEKLGVEVEMADPFKNIEIPEDLFDRKFVQEMAPMSAVGVGLALRRLEGSGL
ncbi:MAG: type IV pilus assembly protein PilM [Nitrospira sp.]|nr:type IV pilus assembly protein PilM [Candidatus Manganitrophaceae bacterium]HIL34201.1 type IV pilus assembly protein PilM [Candidatus Manganitrophaceae bacterium]